MGFLNFMKPKCVICNKRDQNMECIPWESFNMDEKRHFHSECLENIVRTPTKYTSDQVNTALKIIDMLKSKRTKTTYDKTIYQADCEKLSAYCVDNKFSL